MNEKNEQIDLSLRSNSSFKVERSVLIDLKEAKRMETRLMKNL
jgi:hypothetical protein